MWTPRFGSTGDIFLVGLEACRLLQYFCHLSEGDTWTGGGLDGKKGSKDKESKKRKEQRKGRAQGREAEQALLEKTKTKKQTCHPSITFHSAISFSDSFRSYCGKVCHNVSLSIPRFLSQYPLPFTPQTPLLSVLFCSLLPITSVDEFALIALKSHITYDSQGILATNWSTKSSYCNWYGISCNAPQQRVSVINLSSMGLEGTIAPQVGNLSFLVSLDLSNNYFHDSLPKDIGKCKELQQLNLFNNKLVGGIPEAICNLSKLEELYLGNNQLIGEIPKKMNHLQNLKVLSFPMNNLTGSIPATIFNISSLLNISLSNNNLSGSLPKDMRYANPKLKELNLSSNHLSGKIPTGLGQCIQLQVISLAYNDFTGSIPSGIGNLVELQRLSLLNNSLTGIPQAIGSLSNLEGLYLPYNKLTGGIPKEIGNLSNLNLLHLASNGISGPIPVEIFNISSLQGIDFSNNSLSGSLPRDICKHLPNLQWLYLARNHLSGQLPTTLSLCGELLLLSLSFNKFRGSIPREIGNLSKLEEIYLYHNSLVGSIPTSFGNLKALKHLQLGTNNLTGTIPEALFNISKLHNLALVQNHLSGTSGVSFLTSLTNCKFLRTLWIGYNPLKGTLPNSLGNLPIALETNDLTGSIPTTLGQLQKLQALSIAGNRIRGSIPNDLCHLKNLGYLGLSSNKLSGSTPSYIPSRMGKLQNLITLSLSQNKLQGPIPVECGDLVSLESLDLSQNNLSRIIPKSLEALIYLKYLNVSFNKLQGEIPNGGPFVNFNAESFMFNEALCGAPHFQVMACDKNNRTQSWKTKSFILKYILLPVGSTVTLVISHQQLLYATNDFGEDNLIGKGSQGMVYKGVLSNGLIVAIKVFNLEFQRALRSFDSECEVMQGIRHRNLVRIITCCSNLDFKALVLEYMPNGSLEKWLYSHNYFLDLIQRLNIMIYVASALEYLHHDCSSLVVHCDLKPSNVLLDDNMVAHVADFGIAKLLTETESMQQTKTLGTIGYMAPEHGSAGIVSTKSDVYSYEILLMEVFARKKPMDEMFTGDLTLKTWVDCLSSIMALALACTTDSPKERIDMKDVVVELKKSRIKLLIGPIPAEISNISSLQGIDFTNNSLSGSLPMEIGNLSKLEEISLYGNSLIGSIPTSFGNFKALKFLNLGINNLTGMVPEASFNISKLQALALVQNHLSGSLPSSIGTWLPDLEWLSIGANEFSGIIPFSISNMSKLIQLHVACNSFSGNVPKDLGTLPNSLGNFSIALEIFVASACQLRGSIPTGIGNLTNLIELDLGANDLIGLIPTTLGRLQKLQLLHIARNRIRGSIPNDLFHLKNLGYLHLSSNKLFGSIPSCFGDLPTLQALSFDSNALAFNIPSSLWSLKDLLFLNLSSNFLTGNLPPKVGNMKSITALALSKNLVSEIPDGGPFVNFTAKSFIFNEALCGAPHFQVIACDKNTPSQSWKTKSFILKYILLPVASTVTLVAFINLVRIITCCSNLNFKALVLEYMPNGSLDKWLYSHNYFLDLIQRLNIMIDVASALEYLHHDCSSLVVHCDLKPNNVLLDDNMVAHVADFGIARLLTETKSMQQTKTLGTIGYMAPAEYGSDGIVSIKGDVYSYGILLMEVFARKKPMDEMFTGDLTLKTWVESFLSCLSSIMALALACTIDSPEERIHMKDVVVELKKIRINLLIYEKYVQSL
ncbi:unnamed protein product, partial [Vitis vinifera]|uniref:non-specific serine/threonine protein kinase n=1 Tax=Vitis vinifera TaxID=29760 RepID=D7TKJ2_VITVI